jgi:NADP-dependent alcohol dehydrogenase
MGLKTRFSEHNLGEEVIERITSSLEKHGMKKLGEKGSVTPDVVREVLRLSL